MTDVRQLTDEEFRQISAKRLEKDRTFVRDVHFTIDESERDENSAIPGMMIRIEIHTNGEWKSISFTKGFTAVDDTKHLYFFEKGWPCYHDKFLNPEDIIPSGHFTLNASKENKERVLELLKATNVTTEAVQIPEGDLNRFFQSATESPEKMKQKIEDAKVQIPITNMKWLNWAIYNCDQRVTRLLGTKPIMFTKELKRIDGVVVERFNYKARGWETIPGEPKMRFVDHSNKQNERKKRLVITCVTVSILTVLYACYFVLTHTDIKIAHLIGSVLGSLGVFGLSRWILNRVRKSKCE